MSNPIAPQQPQMPTNFILNFNNLENDEVWTVESVNGDWMMAYKPDTPANKWFININQLVRVRQAP